MLNVSIKFRLIASMMFMALMLALGGVMGIVGVRNSNAVIQELFTNQLPSLSNITDTRALMFRARIAIDGVIAHPESPDAGEMIKRAQGFMAKSDEKWALYLRLPSDPIQKKLASEASLLREDYVKQGFTPVITALKAGNK
ncbi:MAG: Tar ligand binding domain-containing protein, partial [Undibacterium sp.]|nr:Tar ligand binding domain-containing protein [Undibacterium sp.]